MPANELTAAHLPCQVRAHCRRSSSRMATREQIDETYNYMDEMWRLSFGNHPDISCAYFDGDFSKSLAQAQKDKHDFILDSLRVERSMRVLDVGCGWGPLLDAIR